MAHEHEQQAPLEFTPQLITIMTTVHYTLQLSAEEAETLYPLTEQQHAQHEYQDGRHR